MKTITKSQAEQWVRDHSDSDEMSDEDCEAAFAAIFERQADDEDREQGLWSHLCAAVAAA